MRIAITWDVLKTFFLTLLLASAAASDTTPFNASQVAPNIALAEVRDDGVTIDLEIFIRDLREFADILPAQLFSNGQDTAEDDATRLERFARDGISLRRPDGTVLPVTVETIEPRMRVDRSSPFAGERDPLSGRIIPAPPEDPRIVFVSLNYSFEGEKPDVIEFLPPRDDLGVPVVIGIHVSDRHLPVSEFRFFTEPMRLTIDWADSWFSAFEDMSLNRRVQSGTSAFLYVEPREIRVETLIRLRELAALIGYDFRPNETLQPKEQSMVLTAAQEFLKARNPLSIDEESAEPFATRASFLALGERGFEVLTPGAEAYSNTAFVGVILSYPIVKMPQQADVVWDVFSDDKALVPVVITDVAGPFFSDVTQTRPEINWTNQLLTFQIPSIDGLPLDREALRAQLIVFILFSVILCSVGAGLWAVKRKPSIASVVLLLAGVVAGGIGIARPSGIQSYLIDTPEPARAAELLASLIEQVNTATLEPDFDARAQALAPLATAQALPDIAAEVDRGIAIRLPGGGIARVTKTAELDTESLTPLSQGRGFQALASWQVTATGGHWGHVHTRRVQYRILAELVAETGFWRLRGLTVLDSKMSGG